MALDSNVDLTADLDYENPFYGADGNDDVDEMRLPDDWEAEQEERAAEAHEQADEEEEELAEEAEEAPAEEEGEPTEEESAEGEGEEEPAEEEPAEEEQPRTESRSEPRIPKSRLDKEIQKRRAAEEELEMLRRQLERRSTTQAPEPTAGQQEEEPVDLGAVYAEALNKALDGDVAEASRMMMEAQAKREAQLRKELGNEYRQTISRESLQQELDLVTEVLETRYDFLRPDAENYDADLVDEIVAVRDGFIAGRKMRPGQALERAADLVLRSRKPEVFEEADPAEELAIEQARTERRAATIKKNATAAKRQAPATADTGTRDPGRGIAQIDIMKLSDEDFEQLSEQELRELRGDFRAP